MLAVIIIAIACVVAVQQVPKKAAPIRIPVAPGSIRPIIPTPRLVHALKKINNVFVGIQARPDSLFHVVSKAGSRPQYIGIQDGWHPFPGKTTSLQFWQYGILIEGCPATRPTSSSKLQQVTLSCLTPSKQCLLGLNSIDAHDIMSLPQDCWGGGFARIAPVAILKQKLVRGSIIAFITTDISDHTAGPQAKVKFGLISMAVRLSGSYTIRKNQGITLFRYTQSGTRALTCRISASFALAASAGLVNSVAYTISYSLAASGTLARPNLSFRATGSGSLRSIFNLDLAANFQVRYPSKPLKPILLLGPYGVPLYTVPGFLSLGVNCALDVSALLTMDAVANLRFEPVIPLPSVNIVYPSPKNVAKKTVRAPVSLSQPLPTSRFNSAAQMSMNAVATIGITPVFTVNILEGMITGSIGIKGVARLTIVGNVNGGLNGGAAAGSASLSITLTLQLIFVTSIASVFTNRVVLQIPLINPLQYLIGKYSIKGNNGVAAAAKSIRRSDDLSDDQLFRRAPGSWCRCPTAKSLTC